MTPDNKILGNEEEEVKGRENHNLHWMGHAEPQGERQMLSFYCCIVIRVLKETFNNNNNSFSWNWNEHSIELWAWSTARKEDNVPNDCVSLENVSCESVAPPKLSYICLGSDVSPINISESVVKSESRGDVRAGT